MDKTYGKLIRIFLVVISTLFLALAIGYVALLFSNIFNLANEYNINFFTFNNIATLTTLIIFIILCLVSIIYVLINLIVYNKLLFKDYIFLLFLIVIITIIFVLFKLLLNYYYSYLDFYTFVNANKDETYSIISWLINYSILDTFCNTVRFILISLLFLFLNYFINNKYDKKISKKKIENKNKKIDNNLISKSIKQTKSLSCNDDILKIIELQNKLNVINNKIDLINNTTKN